MAQAPNLPPYRLPNQLIKYVRSAISSLPLLKHTFLLILPLFHFICVYSHFHVSSLLFLPRIWMQLVCYCLCSFSFFLVIVVLSHCISLASLALHFLYKYCVWVQIIRVRMPFWLCCVRAAASSLVLTFPVSFAIEETHYSLYATSWLDNKLATIVSSLFFSSYVRRIANCLIYVDEAGKNK